MPCNPSAHPLSASSMCAEFGSDLDQTISRLPEIVRIVIRRIGKNREPAASRLLPALPQIHAEIFAPRFFQLRCRWRRYQSLHSAELEG